MKRARHSLPPALRRQGARTCGVRAGQLVGALAAAVLATLASAPVAAASEGTGLLGEVNDETVTFVFFGVIAFFAALVTILSLIQGRLEARKERRRRDLERFS